MVNSGVLILLILLHYLICVLVHNIWPPNLITVLPSKVLKYPLHVNYYLNQPELYIYYVYRNNKALRDLTTGRIESLSRLEILTVYGWMNSVEMLVWQCYCWIEWSSVAVLCTQLHTVYDEVLGKLTQEDVDRIGLCCSWSGEAQEHQPNRDLWMDLSLIYFVPKIGSQWRAF